MSDTEFIMRLKKPLQQVVGFSLLEAVIPFTWFPVPELNIIFNFPQGIGADTPLLIKPGFYSAIVLAEKITDFAVGEGADVNCTYDAQNDAFEFSNASGTSTLELLFSEMDDDTRRVIGRSKYVSVIGSGDKESILTDYAAYPKYLAPRLTGPDMIYMTTDLMIDSQNSKHGGGERIAIPVTVNPGGIIHYSVDADEESIPLKFYQDVQTVHIKFWDGDTNLQLTGTRGQSIFLRFRFHFRH